MLQHLAWGPHVEEYYSHGLRFLVQGDHMTLTAPQSKGELVDMWLEIGWYVSFPAPDRQ